MNILEPYETDIEGGKNMDYRLLKRIPQKYHTAIQDVYLDENGYWCCIECESGWKLKGYYADYTIHEDTFEAVQNVIKQSFKKIT